MRYRRQDGEIITIMPPPRNVPPGKEHARMARSLERWMYLRPGWREELIRRWQKYPSAHWAKMECLPWAVANQYLPTLPCAGITLLEHSRADEDAMRAYWEGWSESCSKVHELQRKWPFLSRVERNAAVEFAEFMAADFFPLRAQLNWMVEHLEDACVRRAGR